MRYQAELTRRDVVHGIPSRGHRPGREGRCPPRTPGTLPLSLNCHQPVNSCWLQPFGDWCKSCWNGPRWACVSCDWRNGLLPGREEDLVPPGQGFLRGLTVSQKAEHSHTWNKWIMGLAHMCGGEYIITRSDEFLSKIYVWEVLFELIY